MSSEIKADKWSPASGTAGTIGDSGDTYTVPSGVTLAVASGATITNSGTATGFGITEANFRPNAEPILINGDFQIQQRRPDSSATGLTSESSSYIVPDRWCVSMLNIGTWSMGNGAAGPTNYGFKKSLWMDNTATKTPDANSLLAVSQLVESQNCQIFNWGTARAEKITVGFWIKATKTGTNILELLQNDSDRICCQSYTVDVTDTWEFKVVNFPADTSGSVNNDTGPGLQIRFYLAAGSDFAGGTLATTWAARSNPNRAVGQVNNADNTDNNWQIAGVQIELGEYTSSTIPPFQFETVPINLLRCQRYYQEIGRGTRADNLMYFSAYNFDGTSTMFGSYNFRTTMRTGPSIDQTTGTNYYTFKCNNATDDFDGVNGFRGGIDGGELYLSGGSSVGSSSAGMAGVVMGKDASSKIALDAELS